MERQADSRLIAAPRLADFLAARSAARPAALAAAWRVP